MKETTPASPITSKDLLDDLRTLVLEAETMLGSTVNETTSAAVHSLRERFNAAHEKLGAMCADAKRQVVAGARCTDTAIRANPYQSLAIAAGVGLVAGILLGRRSK